MNCKAMVATSLILFTLLASCGTAAVNADAVGGKFGNALEFDGTNDFVLVPDMPSLRTPTNELTIEAWIYFPSNTSGVQLIIRKWLDSNGGWASYVLGRTENNRIYGSVMNNVLNQFPAWTTNQTIPELGIENTWAHIAFTWKKGTFSSADGHVYVNNINANTSFQPNGYSSNFTIGYANYELLFGRKSTDWESYYFMGKLDEIRISNISRASFELGTPPSTDAYTFGLWHFDEGSGGVTLDSSGYSNNGDLYGPTWTGVHIKQETTFTLQTTTQTAEVVDDTTLIGTLSAARSGQVTLYWSINCTCFDHSRNITMTNGYFSEEFWLDSPGMWYFKVAWSGDHDYIGAESNTVTVSVRLPPQAISLTCNAASQVLPAGSTMTISGSMTPAASGKTITLLYTPPSGATISRNVTTDSQGQYKDMYQPQSEGQWSVTAIFAGDSQYLQTTTSPVVFNVTSQPAKTGCVVATATYGSAMAPQVQALRDFRENVALKSFAGSSFMAIFNEWYYSWSPPVAAAIAPSEYFRGVMQVVLQPLLNILEVAAYCNSALSFNGEFAIVSTGFVAASLIGLVYFVPLMALALVGAKKYRKNLTLPSVSTALRFTTVPWIISIALIIVAEFALAPLLMMAATSAFVVCTILLIVSITSIGLASLYRRD